MQVTSTVQRDEEYLVVERVSPIDDRVVSSESASDRATCLAVAARAAAAFPDWSARPVSERAEYLTRLADEIDRRADSIALIITEEIGAPSDWARANVQFASKLLRGTAKQAGEVGCEDILERGDGFVSKAVRVPCGVCLGISSWNAPFILGVRAIAAPLLCGNTVLLKGSEYAPRAYRLIEEALAATDLPKDVATVVLARPEDSEDIAEALISSPVVQRVNFTGSTRIGRRVAGLCAKYLKRPLLELGGQCAMIVLDDANLGAAAEAVLKGAFRNQGQICMSTERLIVSNSVADALVEWIEAGRKTLIHGDPRKPETQVGPVISRPAAERLAGMISDAVSKGARLVGGGQVRGAYVEPTLLDRVEPDMRVYQEEVFGPLLSITRVASDLEAITVANDSEYGLACSVFSQNPQRAQHVAAKIQSGICHINSGTINDSAYAPFGGMKSSGYGRFGGRWGIHEFMELRWITQMDEPETNTQ